MNVDTNGDPSPDRGPSTLRGTDDSDRSDAAPEAVERPLFLHRQWMVGVVLIFAVAAIVGDQVNYSIGRYFGPKVFGWQNSRWFNRDAFDRTHAFYEQYGGITIVVARFMPFLRTFAPFVAGVAEMTRSKFTAYNVVGALLWVLGITTAGYLFGNIPWVKDNLDKIIWAMILIPGLIGIFGAWKASRPQPA